MGKKKLTKWSLHSFLLSFIPATLCGWEGLDWLERKLTRMAHVCDRGQVEMGKGGLRLIRIHRWMGLNGAICRQENKDVCGGSMCDWQVRGRIPACWIQARCCSARLLRL